MAFDFIAIGDVVSDEFITLSDVRIDTDPDEGDRGYKEICFRFGDKVPFEKAEMVYAVGNSANAAVSAARLGLKTAFVSDIGDDELGTKKRESLEKDGVHLDYLTTHAGMPSNHHYVLQYGPERTILVNHAEYPYSLPQDMEEPKWIYFSSVGEHGIDYRHEIGAWLAARPSVKFAFQPGVFDISVGAKKLEDLYTGTDLFFCNKEEAQRVTGLQTKDVKELIAGVHALGPAMVAITDGPEGAYVSDGETVWHMPMYPDPKPPVDRTGAGDAFSSTFTASLAAGYSIPEALRRAPINSMSVVQYVGAQAGLLTEEQMQKYLDDAPEGYEAKVLE